MQKKISMDVVVFYLVTHNFRSINSIAKQKNPSIPIYSRKKLEKFLEIVLQHVF